MRHAPVRALVMACAAGCFGGGGGGGGSPHLDIDTIGTLAVGRDWPVWVRVQCTDPQIGEVNCAGRVLASVEEVTVSDASIAAAGEIAVMDGEGRISLHVLAAGSATVTVRALDDHGREYSVDGDFVAMQPDRLVLTMECDLGQPESAPPWPVAASQRFFVDAQMYAGDTYLYGNGPFPVDPGPFEILGFGEGVSLQAPDTPVLGSITSPLDASARVDVRVYDTTTIDGITVSAAAAQPIALTGAATPASLETLYTIGGAPPCVRDYFYRPTVSVFVETQQLCGLDASGAYQMDGIDPDFPVYGDFEGICSGRVSLDGTAVEGRFNVSFASQVPRRDGAWVWENPLPQGEDLVAIGGSADDDAWGVGAYGTIVRWDGAAWSLADSPTTTDFLTDVSATSRTDAWAVGSYGNILHWDGASWSIAATRQGESLQGVWARGPNDVWVVGGTGPGQPGLVLHWDGSSWERVASGAPGLLMAVWGAGDEIWAAGTGGAVVHFDGAAWSTIPVTAGSLLFVTGSAGNDVWMGGGPDLYHWDGASLAPVAALPYLSSLAAGPGEVWASSGESVYRWTGSGWSAPVDKGARYNLIGMWRAPGGDTWGVGYAGNIVRESGDAWTRVTTGVDGAGRPMHAVWAAGPDDVWAVGEEYTTTGPSTGFILHRDAAGWSIHTATPYAMYGLWGAAWNDVWAVGDNGTVMRWNGASWSTLPTGTTQRLTGVWGTSAGDVWISGRLGDVLHWTGGTSFDFDTPESVVGGPDPAYTGVWGAGSSDVWVVGEVSWYDTVVNHWNGLLWLQRDPPGGKWYDMAGVWGTGGDDVWVAGSSPFVYHWTGDWQSVFTGIGGGKVWGLSSDDVWVASAMLHWDGVAWERAPARGGVGSIHGIDRAHTWGAGGWAGIQRLVP